MACMQAYTVAALLCAAALILLVFANCGTTFSTSILQHFYFVRVDHGGDNILLGLYNSCTTSGVNAGTTCGKPVFLYDGVQDILSFISSKTSVSSTYHTLTKFGCLVGFAGILTVISFFFGGTTSQANTRNISNGMGAVASVIAGIGNLLALALLLYAYWETIAAIQTSGVSHSWGPSLYMVGIAGLFVLIAFGCYMSKCFGRRRATKDYDDTHANYNFQPYY
ncbi:hypothetical protein BZG36_00368 [Bifiguratus adelaidae]|uniref:Autophagy-related protein n=1 Tax=Bifiguratus adelaidae TaxID=1938954 RepID=A0A261Y7W4_9FUNG|nr:hypothetical protein BZG36_00368 [Bifiguratus adelaidae]